MEPLVRAALAGRTLARKGHGLLLVCALSVYVALGGAKADVGPLTIAAIAVWALLLVPRVVRKLRDTNDAGLRLDFEIGSLLTIALEAALVRYDGGLSGH